MPILIIYWSLHSLVWWSCLENAASNATSIGMQLNMWIHFSCKYPLISEPQWTILNKFFSYLHNYCIIKLFSIVKWSLDFANEDIIWLPGLFCASHALMNVDEFHELFLQHHIFALNLSNEFML